MSSFKEAESRRNQGKILKNCKYGNDRRKSELKDDLLGWDCKIEVLLFVAVSPIFNNRESPPFQSPIVF